MLARACCVCYQPFTFPVNLLLKIDYTDIYACTPDCSTVRLPVENMAIMHMLKIVTCIVFLCLEIPWSERECVYCLCMKKPKEGSGLGEVTVCTPVCMRKSRCGRKGCTLRFE